MSADDDVTVTISAELKEEISADLATGESISDLIGQILDASGEEAEDVGAAADITAASLALAGGIWDEVSAACTVKDTGDVMFTAGPTQLACGDFELTLA